MFAHFLAVWPGSFFSFLSKIHWHLVSLTDKESNFLDAGVLNALLADLKVHNNWVDNAMFSPDGKRIITVSSDRAVKLWMTPDAIMTYLKTSPIPQLTENEKKELGIEEFKID